jgi:predicted secreted Zn-dependent protease
MFSVRCLGVILAVVAVGLASGSAQAAPLAVTNTHLSYAIRGSTAAELRAQMEAKGPGAYFGETTFHITDRFRGRMTTMGCVVSSIQVHLVVVYTMPSWRIPAETDPALVARYRRFHDRLTVHENGHGAIALAGAKSVVAAMQSVGPHAGCAATVRAVDAAASSALARVNVKEAGYDKATKHGSTQGATFNA